MDSAQPQGAPNGVCPPTGRILEEAVGGQKYVIGDSFTAADIVVGSAIGWAAFVGILGDHPLLAAYYQGLSERPAYKRAHAD